MLWGFCCAASFATCAGRFSCAKIKGKDLARADFENPSHEKELERFIAETAGAGGLRAKSPRLN